MFWCGKTAVGCIATASVELNMTAWMITYVGTIASATAVCSHAMLLMATYS
jgi:hypothetical protein